MFKFLKSDLISGFLVFLIALPLCLGIAKASGFPPIAGIYTAVVGGLLVTFITNTALTIKGPAAGLIVIAVGAVEELGGKNMIKGYQLTLAVIVISGILQVLFGLMKSGKLGDFFPISVIHGMLAAIGLIIISKQIHITMGVVPTGKTPLALLQEIPYSFAKMNPEVAVIGFLSMLILFLHPLIKNRYFKRFPAPLLVLSLAIPLGYVFNLSHEHDYDLGSLHFHINPAQLLVALPDNFFSGITFPDFSEIFSLTSVKYIFMFALVGSIESILSAKAIDSLDPEQRKSNLNRDLVAVGIGNSIAGFIGGLPMISEIVRSSANINNGGKTKMSNFYHGLFLLLFVMLAASLIQKIPNAALSAMLVYTGFKLASPAEFRKIKIIGYDQLFIFLSTLIITLMTDLLVGVAAGILLKIILHLMRNTSFNELINLNMKTRQTADGIHVELFGVTCFLNYLKFKTFIDQQSRDSKITLDFSHVKLADHTFLGNIHQLQNEFIQKGGQLDKQGFEKHHFQSSHHLASRILMQNPYQISKQQELTGRELKMQRLAQSYNYEFEATASPSMVRPYLSPFSILPKFKRAKNFILGTENSFNTIMCDIRYENIDDFSKETASATIAVIHNIAKGGIPDFYTQKESSIFNLSTKYNFKKFTPSEKCDFLIYGNNNELLQSFFTNEIIQHIQDNNYTLECQRRVILIHKNWQSINDEEKLSKMLNFTHHLAGLITSHK